MRPPYFILLLTKLVNLWLVYYNFSINARHSIFFSICTAILSIRFPITPFLLMSFWH